MTSIVLVVDDEEDLVTLLKIGLKKQGFEVFSAGNGKTALDLITKENIDVVLLDYFLPDLNGQEIFEAIRNMEDKAHIPVVFFSASEEKIEELPNYDNTEKMVKPVQVSEISERIHKLIG